MSSFSDIFSLAAAFSFARTNEEVSTVDEGVMVEKRAQDANDIPAFLLARTLFVEDSAGSIMHDIAHGSDFLHSMVWRTLD